MQAVFQSRLITGGLLLCNGGGERPCADMTLCHQEGRDIDAGSPVLGGTQPSDCSHDPHPAQPLPSWCVRACVLSTSFQKFPLTPFHPFVHSFVRFIKCVLSVYCVPSLVLGLRMQRQIGWWPRLWGAESIPGGDKEEHVGCLVLDTELHARHSQKSRTSSYRFGGMRTNLSESHLAIICLVAMWRKASLSVWQFDPSTSSSHAVCTEDFCRWGMLGFIKHEYFLALFILELW